MRFVRKALSLLDLDEGLDQRAWDIWIGWNDQRRILDNMPRLNDVRTEKGLAFFCFLRGLLKRDRSTYDKFMASLLIRDCIKTI